MPNMSIFHSDYLLSVSALQSGAFDDAERKRLERNNRQRQCRAKMTEEERQEINRKQREFRARKKAESNNAATVTAASTPSVPGLKTNGPMQPSITLHYNHDNQHYTFPL